MLPTTCYLLPNVIEGDVEYKPYVTSPFMHTYLYTHTCCQPVWANANTQNPNQVVDTALLRC